MFLRVAAIYERNSKNVFVPVMSAAHKEAEKKECLAIFEKDTLPEIESSLVDGEIIVDTSPNLTKTKAEYFLYAIYHSEYKTDKRTIKEHICVMVTDRKMYGKNQDGNWADIGEREFRMLLVNINHVYVRGAALNVTLQKIINDPPNYIGREIHIQNLLNEVEATKRVLIDEVIPKVTQRGEQIAALEADTIKLSESSSLFNANANKLKKGSACCSALPEMPSMPNIPYINPVPNPLK